MNNSHTNRLVFIILVNYNGIKDTQECISSLLRLNFKQYKIVVIDNKSSNNPETIVSNVNEIHLIQSQKNYGFANAVNKGIRHSLQKGADFIWILNNDTIVDKECLKKLLISYTSEKRPGIAGSKILNYHQPEIIDYDGGIFDPKTGYTKHVNRNKKNRNDNVASVVKTQFITGCSMFLSKEVIVDIGLMDESYFLYCEDIDWCVRARQKGYDLFVVPSSIVYHKISAATKRTKGSAAYYITRNTLFLLKKIAKNREVSWSKRLLLDLSRAKDYLLAGNFRAPLSIVRGYWSFLMDYHGPMK